MAFEGRTRKSTGNRNNLGTYAKETKNRHRKQNVASERAIYLNDLNYLIKENGGTLPKDWDVRKARKLKTKANNGYSK